MEGPEEPDKRTSGVTAEIVQRSLKLVNRHVAAETNGIKAIIFRDVGDSMHERLRVNLLDAYLGVIFYLVDVQHSRTTAD